MNATWLHREGRPRVLVCFAGWGMDARPFAGLASTAWDVLLCHDYRTLAPPPPALAEADAYVEKALVAWSFGCAVANRVTLERGWTLTRALAINGTLVPQDAERGIPDRLLTATAEHLPAGGWEKFVRRMCAAPAAYAHFDARRPDRSPAEQAEELAALRTLSAPAVCVFRTARVAAADRIIAPDNQRRCWAQHGVPALPLDGPHYPFHLWQTWEEVLACTP